MDSLDARYGSNWRGVWLSIAKVDIFEELSSSLYSLTLFILSCMEDDSSDSRSSSSHENCHGENLDFGNASLAPVDLRLVSSLQCTVSSLASSSSTALFQDTSSTLTNLPKLFKDTDSAGEQEAWPVQCKPMDSGSDGDRLQDNLSHSGFHLGLAQFSDQEPYTIKTSQPKDNLHVKDNILERYSYLSSERAGSCPDILSKRPKLLTDSQLVPYVIGACSGGRAYVPISSIDLTDESFFQQNGSDCLHNLFCHLHDETCRCTLKRGCSGNNISVKSNPSMLVAFEASLDLTDDLLHMIFSFLGHVDLCRAAMVCKQWQAASVHEDFWKCLNFEYRNISVSQFANLCRRYPNATEVNLFGTPSVDVLTREAVISLRNIVKLNVGKGLLGEYLFDSLSEWRLLKHLIINDAFLGNGQEVSISHDGLHHLQIIKCRVMRISLRCPQLETLSLRRSNMAHALLNCPLLLDLDIASCHKLSDAGIRIAVTSCLLLSVLDMSNCVGVTDETLRDISHACTNLHVLNASYCPNISLEGVRLPMLRNLKLQNCEGITSASMTAIAHSHFLEELELDCCSLLTLVSLDLPCLQHIRLRHCRKFSELNLRTPLLSSINISNCPALSRISIMSNSLQKLALQKQESLSSLTLQCNQLQEVDLTDCESLSNSVCDVFGDYGGCAALRTLVLDNCESLTHVGLKSSTLVDLSLVGCRGVTSICLECPNLQRVQLDGCDHLESARFCPVGLRSLNLGICPKLNTLEVEAPYAAILELKGCGVLSQASIICPNLIFLDASFCCQLPDECLSTATATCQLVESLVLTSCSSMGPAGLFSLNQLQHLRLLDLSYTYLTSLQPVFESCRNLEVLKLQACKYLEDSSLDALYKDDALPALRELDLSYGLICQSALESLLAHCTRLTHVSLNGCMNMHDLEWDTNGSYSMELTVNEKRFRNFRKVDSDHSLENLCCVGCPNVKKVIISESARCHYLSALNLSLSANLRAVSLACCNLTFLNLSHCCSLEFLKLACPRLSSLFLQSCNIGERALEEAILNCSVLETLDIRYCPKIHGESIFRLRLACPNLRRIFNSLSP